MTIPTTLLDRNVARLSFCLQHERLDKFGPVYARERAPVLTCYGLVPLDEVVNSHRPGFSRVFFAVEHPNALEEGRDERAADPAWRECLITWGAAYR